MIEILKVFKQLASKIELFVKYSKESTKTLCLLKTGNKVVEMG
jgi:hypothetical protein